jgi:hypothetical protein
LNAKFAARLHNSNDADIPAVRMWRSSFTLNAPKSIPWFLREKNPLFRVATFLPIFGRRLTTGYSLPTPAFSKKLQKQIVGLEISKLDTDSDNVAGTLQFSPAEGYRHCLRSNAFSSDQVKVPVLRWLIGNVAIHMPCQNQGCDEVLSRSHAATCSGAHDALALRYPVENLLYSTMQPSAQSSEPLRSTLLDVILNKYRMDTPAQIYEDIASSVSLIYEKCLGYRQKANGFFVPASDIVDASQSSLAPPLQRSPPRPRHPG